MRHRTLPRIRRWQTCDPEDAARSSSVSAVMAGAPAVSLAAAAKRWSKESEGWSKEKRSSKDKRPSKKNRSSKDMRCRMVPADRLSVSSTAEVNATSVPRPPHARASRPISATRAAPGGQGALRMDCPKRTGVETRPAARHRPSRSRAAPRKGCKPKANPAMSAAIPRRIKRIQALTKIPVPT